jgi:hypothetical protein
MGLVTHSILHKGLRVHEFCMASEDTTVTCPDCGAEIDVADRLRSHVEHEVRRELTVTLRTEIESEVESRVEIERAEEIEQQAALSARVENQREEITSLREKEIELEDIKADREIELKEARAEAAREAKRELNRELDEKISERVKEETGDKDLAIEKLKTQLNRQNAKIEELEAQRTTDHGELEGEVLELAVEGTLRQLFPRDSISEVKKGAYGADVLQVIRNGGGSSAGKIIWECKKHKNWNDDWVPKLRQDAIDANADTMVIVSTAMPEGLDSFGRIDDIFVCRYHEVPVVAELLRHAVLKASNERVREEHMMTIQQRVLEYVSGPEFAMVMRGVMQAYQAFEDDLRREEQYMKRRWKARRGYLTNIMDSITSMLGKFDQLGAGDFEVMDELEGGIPPEFRLPGLEEEE